MLFSTGGIYLSAFKVIEQVGGSDLLVISYTFNKNRH